MSECKNSHAALPKSPQQGSSGAEYSPLPADACAHSATLLKMRRGELYDFTDPDVDDSITRARRLCARLNTLQMTDPDYRPTLEALIPGIPPSSAIAPPLICDHGHGIHIGHDTFINYGATFLDGATVNIGNHVKIGPNCQFYTPLHPFDYQERRLPMEWDEPITVGDDTWLGGGVIVCPGVTIGRRCIIGAGSVVVHDIPDDSLAAGNPATVKRRLTSVEPPPGNTGT